MNSHHALGFVAVATRRGLGIGQGYDLASPLQMAMAYATVANGGVSYYPRLVHAVMTPDGNPAHSGISMVRGSFS